MDKAQFLPTRWEDREKLRQKGQFWTPAWVAEAMMAYVLPAEGSVFDPAVGKGAFYQALQALNQKLHRQIQFQGYDIDAEILAQARQEGFLEEQTAVECRDFLLQPPTRKLAAIIANPPYIRHHRLTPQLKTHLKEFGKRLLGKALDGRAGLHVYFLLQALERLTEQGKLAFIMPADTCEGLFARDLWAWIAQKFCVEAVISFTPAATPFPKVDTNALVFLIQKSPPVPEVHWIRVNSAHPEALFQWVNSGFSDKHSSFQAVRRSLQEALETGLSRPPQSEVNTGYCLADFAKVMRGIATGANEFFFLTEARVQELGLPRECLKPALGKTRWVMNDVFDQAAFETMRHSGQDVWLLALDGRPAEKFPLPLQHYLRQGESLGLPQKALISTRRPWYKMEQRAVPPFLFAYLGRRKARFIQNNSQAIPLTGFLCLYPHSSQAEYRQILWKILQHPQTLTNLALVGKSYGSGSIKVEPRSLERLPIPSELIPECRSLQEFLRRG